MFIRTGTILHDDRLEAATDLRTEGGRITAIAKDLRPEPGEQVLDATGCYVLPGPGRSPQPRHPPCHGAIRQPGRVRAAHGCGGRDRLRADPARHAAGERRGHAAGPAETEAFRLTPNLIGFRPEITYLAKTGAGSADSLTKITVETHRGALRGGAGDDSHLGCVARAGRRGRLRPVVPGARHRNQPGAQRSHHRADAPGRGCRSQPGHALLRHLRPAAPDRSRRLSGRADRLHPGGGSAHGRDHPRRGARSPVAGREDASAARASSASPSSPTA